ncbi:hypothetical protein GCM10010406_21560 [Streptomyces thermolineatus]|uniref:Competence protein CoiA nuclease-like domain-containing protein n=1 Tax=Streptomyces thermolineatus TaxID=44033 RepID=A0ABN3LIM2_9ACTN
MPNNILIHTEYGRLDLRESHLGRPDLPWLWQILLGDKRRVERRQLMCGEACLAMGRTEWMRVYEYKGRRIAAHQSKEAEQRHQSNESDEHKAYKERTVRAAEEGGFRARAETPSSDGKVRSDVLVYGAGLPTAFEIQRSYISDQTISRRTREAADHGLAAAWHTDRHDLAERNEVAWTRTDNLPVEAIRTDAHLKIRGGVRVLDWERCDERRPTPCPDKGRGRCGRWHPKSRTLEVLYDDFVRGVASGEYAQVAYKEKRQTFRLWLPAADRDRYEDSIGRSASVTARAPRPRASAAADGDPTCRARARIEAVPPSVVVRNVPGRCNAGVEMCGEPARLYPCGWRCDEHSPAAARARNGDRR